MSNKKLSSMKLMMFHKKSLGNYILISTKDININPKDQDDFQNFDLDLG